MKKLFFICWLPIIFFSCKNNSFENPDNQETTVNYTQSDAKNFSINKNDDSSTIITVSNLMDNSKENYTYILYKDKKPSSATKLSTENTFYIKVPLENVACVSTTHIAMLSALNAENTLKGATNTNLVYDEKIRDLVSDNKITELGNEGNLNYETLLSLGTDGIFTYGLNDVSQINKIKSLGLTPIVVTEFREKTPLARAEWIKFFGVLLDKEALADSIFNEVKEEYTQLQTDFSTIENRPTVFTGIPFQGTWYVPAGESYLATYIKDAGGDYLWKDSQGQLSLSLDLEAVFAKAQNAQKWLDVGFVFSKADVANNDQRLTKFSAFDTGEMYNYTKRVHQEMGFDIYESAIVYPNVVLKDFAKALHPEKISDHKFFYYEKMK